MEEQLWVEPMADGIILAKVRGVPTIDLISECQRRVVRLRTPIFKCS